MINGSTWTLQYEWMCYLLVAALLLVGVLSKARPVVVGVAAVVAAAHVAQVVAVLAAAAHAGSAVLVATHDPRVWEVADRVVRLDEGRVTAL